MLLNSKKLGACLQLRYTTRNLNFEKGSTMKKFLFTLLLSLVPQMGLAEVATQNCGHGYGPDHTNLAIVLDDEVPHQPLLIGYQVIGTFWELRSTGCTVMNVSQNQLLCDGKVVGDLGPQIVVTDDDVYSGYRAPLKPVYERVRISGSCRPADEMPLTIEFR
jgi:hypothetical protein